MSRVSAIVILLAAPLLTQPAAAQDCLCVIEDGFGSVAWETPDTTIESTVASEDAADDAASIAHAAAPAPSRNVLWCTSANDSRCQPMQPTDAPLPRALAGGPVATMVVTTGRPRVRFFVEKVEMSPRYGLAPSVGVRAMLDRPPRA